MERDELTSQRFSESLHMGDEAAITEATGGRRANEAKEEAEAREAAIETARQERINAQQVCRTQLEGSRGSIIAGIDQETFNIAWAQRDMNRFPSNNENLQRGLASLLPRIWRFRRFVTACANDADKNLNQNSDPEEITAALDQLLAMVSLYWQEHVARYRRDAIRLSSECTRLRNSNSG